MSSISNLYYKFHPFSEPVEAISGTQEPTPWGTA